MFRLFLHASLVGFFPLVIATGAGSASRWAIGTALFGGLLVSTVLSFLIVPVLYVVIKSLESRFLNNKPPSEPPGLGRDYGSGDPEFPPGKVKTSSNPDIPTPTRFQEEDNPV